MLEENPTKQQLWDFAWQLLIRGKNDRKHPYYTPVFTTVSPSLHPRSRTLVLREALREEAELWCYTDVRSQKAVDVNGNPAVAWTFWSAKHQVQVNVAGTARWMTAEAAQLRYASMPKHSRKAYATLSAPGVAQETPGQGLPVNWDSVSIEETEYAADNFGVLITKIDQLEVLRLSRSGHLRLLGKRREDSSWQLDWLIP